ncbi:hypothetical protein QJS04_geneDACA021473 [Acorus gramineus]|uniref:Uncharacterized protein n=1 Tax=Acorus gramineus TaxID=55184 RepID=A0AAV9A694_ACOGR|nr:hypothetical protein QJS04_geneDACA021473 [Acorus gramineus]
MKRASPWDQSVIISCDSGSSDSEDDSTKPKNKNGAGEFDKDIMSEVELAYLKPRHGVLKRFPERYNNSGNRQKNVSVHHQLINGVKPHGMSRERGDKLEIYLLGEKPFSWLSV